MEMLSNWKMKTRYPTSTLLAPKQLLIYPHLEHLVKYDLSTASRHGFNKGYTSYIRSRAEKHARTDNEFHVTS